MSRFIMLGCCRCLCTWDWTASTWEKRGKPLMCVCVCVFVWDRKLDTVAGFFLSHGTHICKFSFAYWQKGWKLHLNADGSIQSNLQCVQGVHYLSVCVLCSGNIVLYLSSYRIKLNLVCVFVKVSIFRWQAGPAGEVWMLQELLSSSVRLEFMKWLIFTPWCWSVLHSSLCLCKSPRYRFLFPFHLFFTLLRQHATNFGIWWISLNWLIFERTKIIVKRLLDTFALFNCFIFHKGNTKGFYTKCRILVIGQFHRYRYDIFIML